jgi:hypothetical protein
LSAHVLEEFKRLVNFACGASTQPEINKTEAGFPFKARAAGFRIRPIKPISGAAMLMDLLSKAATVAMLIFVVFSMLAMGTGLTLARITGPLRNVRLVLLALLANFVLMPIGAEALAKVLRLDEPVSSCHCSFRESLLIHGRLLASSSCSCCCHSPSGLP